MSKSLIRVGMLMALAAQAPAWAQSADAAGADAAVVDVVPADAAEGADAAATEEGAAPADESAAAVEEAPAEAAADPVAESAAESATESAADAAAAEATEAAADAAEDSGSASEDGGGSSSGGMSYFIALDRTEAKLDLSDDALEQRFGDDRLDGGLYRAHLGVQFVPGISLEGVVGFAPDKADAGDEFKAKQHYAVYLMPTGNVLDLFEVSARMGYAWSKAEAGNGQTERFDGVSYGVELQLPVRVIAASLPNLRVVVGATVLSQDKDARTASWHYGLRYDFGS